MAAKAKVAPAQTWRNRNAEYRLIKASELQSHEGNWRVHPQYQEDALTSVLDEVGIVGALLVYRSERQGGLTTIDGHLRKSLDSDQEWPCLVSDLNDEEADLILATHDSLTAFAHASKDALGALLQRTKPGTRLVQELLGNIAERQQIALEAFRERGAFQPNLAPNTDTGTNVQESDMQHSAEKITATIHRQRDLRGALCPYCGEEFYLEEA